MIRFTCKALLVSFIAILICVFIMLFYRSEMKKSRNNNWVKQTKLMSKGDTLHIFEEVCIY